MKSQPLGPWQTIFGTPVLNGGPMECEKQKRAGKQIFAAAILLALIAARLCTRTWYLKSGSMAPEYPTGSIIITTVLLKPDVGSVCAYRHNGITVIHRVIGETEDGFVFKGDANNVADPYTVTADEIEGRLILSLPPLITIPDFQ